jgi:hypothetical protein
MREGEKFVSVPGANLPNVGAGADSDIFGAAIVLSPASSGFPAMMGWLGMASQA